MYGIEVASEKNYPSETLSLIDQPALQSPSSVSHHCISPGQSAGTSHPPPAREWPRLAKTGGLQLNCAVCPYTCGCGRGCSWLLGGHSRVGGVSVAFKSKACPSFSLGWAVQYFSPARRTKHMKTKAFIVIVQLTEAHLTPSTYLIFVMYLVERQQKTESEFWTLF